MKKILELKQKRAALVKQARELIEVAEKENRSLDEEQYDRIEKDIDGLGKQIEREERLYNLENPTNSGNEPNKFEPQQRDIHKPNEEYRGAFWKAMR